MTFNCNGCEDSEVYNIHTFVQWWCAIIKKGYDVWVEKLWNRQHFGTFLVGGKIDEFHMKLGHFAKSNWKPLYHYYNTSILEKIYTQFTIFKFFLIITLFSNACNDPNPKCCLWWAHKLQLNVWTLENTTLQNFKVDVLQMPNSSLGQNLLCEIKL